VLLMRIQKELFLILEQTKKSFNKSN
jgi:hypothetical protein